MSRIVVRYAAIAVALVVSGCGSSSVDPRPAFHEVRETVAQRTGEEIVWHPVEDRPMAASEVEAMLADGLTMQEAVQVALVNNQRLQATYERLGIAQAQVVQATLLRNPAFDGSLRFVEGPGSDYILEMGVIQDVLDVFLIPLRKRVSQAELAVVQSEVAARVLGIMSEVQIALIGLQAAQQTLELNRLILKATEASFDGASRLRQAGNITALALANERALYEQAKLAVASSELAVLRRRERMNALLGLWADRTAWQVSEQLPAPPQEPLDVNDLERRVVENSLDLQMLRERMTAVAARMDIDISQRIFPELAAGGEAEREPDGTWSVGPAWGIGVPLFDQGVAQEAAAVAQLRRLWDEYTATAIDLRSQARVARYSLLNARQRSEYYRRVVIPLAEQITGETQLQYNAMQLGVFQLLAAKQREIDARRGSILALQDYWVARAQLELLLSGVMGPQVSSDVSLDGMTVPAREGGH